MANTALHQDMKQILGDKARWWLTCWRPAVLDATTTEQNELEDG